MLFSPLSPPGIPEHFVTGFGYGLLTLGVLWGQGLLVIASTLNNAWYRVDASYMFVEQINVNWCACMSLSLRLAPEWDSVNHGEMEMEEKCVKIFPILFSPLQSLLSFFFSFQINKTLLHYSLIAEATQSTVFVYMDIRQV